jgi:hypothetical protein
VREGLLAGFNELRAREADQAHELLILKRRAEQLRQIHTPREFSHATLCNDDNHRWPCPTRRVIDGLDGDDWGEGPGS